jgi:hypothetical protein
MDDIPHVYDAGWYYAMEMAIRACGINPDIDLESTPNTEHNYFYSIEKESDDAKG